MTQTDAYERKRDRYDNTKSHKKQAVFSQAFQLQCGDQAHLQQKQRKDPFEQIEKQG